MTTTKLTGALMALMLLGAGCGGDDDQEADDTSATTPTVAETVDVTVLLTDTPPLEALFNHDDVTCTTVFFGDDVVTVEVALRDAEGTLIGSEQLDEVGGTFDGGCEWPVEFDQVPDSDFYEVTVQAGDIERTATAEGGADTVIDVDL